LRKADVDLRFDACLGQRWDVETGPRSTPGTTKATVVGDPPVAPSHRMTIRSAGGDSCFLAEEQSWHTSLARPFAAEWDEIPRSVSRPRQRTPAAIAMRETRYSSGVYRPAGRRRVRANGRCYRRRDEISGRDERPRVPRHENTARLRGFSEAAEGIRTLDLLHGKQKVVSRASRKSPPKHCSGCNRSAMASQLLPRNRGGFRTETGLGSVSIRPTTALTNGGPHPVTRSRFAVGDGAVLLLLHTSSSRCRRIGSLQTPACRLMREPARNRRGLSASVRQRERCPARGSSK
jgi:hypothetical protein